MKRNTVLLLVLLVLVLLPPLAWGVFNRFQAERERESDPARAARAYETAARLLFWERGLLGAGCPQRVCRRRNRTRAGSFAGSPPAGDSLPAGDGDAGRDLRPSGGLGSRLRTGLAPVMAGRERTPGGVCPPGRIRCPNAGYRPGNRRAHPSAGAATVRRISSARVPFWRCCRPQKPPKPRAGDARPASTTRRPNGCGTTFAQALAENAPAYRALLLGRALASRNEWRLALRAFRAALEANPADAEAWAWQAEARYQTGEAAALAEQDYQTALSLNPNSAGVQAMAGLYRERRGEFPQAESHYRRAVAQTPNGSLASGPGARAGAA